MIRWEHVLERNASVEKYFFWRGGGGNKIVCRLIAGSNHRQQLRRQSRKLLGTKKSPKIEPLKLLALKDWIGDVPYLLSVVNVMPGDASTKINNPL